MEIYNIKDPSNVRQEYAKFSGLRTEEGDVVSYISPSGGGFGSPLERDTAKVLDDVLDDIISVDEARNDYGVVMTEVDDGYGWQVDESATEKLRASMS
jgi:N-methylhydantoinase B